MASRAPNRNRNSNQGQRFNWVQGPARRGPARGRGRGQRPQNRPAPRPNMPRRGQRQNQQARNPAIAPNPNRYQPHYIKCKEWEIPLKGITNTAPPVGTVLETKETAFAFCVHPCHTGMVTNAEMIMMKQYQAYQFMNLELKPSSATANNLNAAGEYNLIGFSTLEDLVAAVEQYGGGVQAVNELASIRETPWKSLRSNSWCVPYTTVPLIRTKKMTEYTAVLAAAPLYWETTVKADMDALIALSDDSEILEGIIPQWYLCAAKNCSFWPNNWHVNVSFKVKENNPGQKLAKNRTAGSKPKPDTYSVQAPDSMAAAMVDGNQRYVLPSSHHPMYRSKFFAIQSQLMAQAIGVDMIFMLKGQNSTKIRVVAPLKTNIEFVLPLLAEQINDGFEMIVAYANANDYGNATMTWDQTTTSWKVAKSTSRHYYVMGERKEYESFSGIEGQVVRVEGMYEIEGINVCQHIFYETGGSTPVIPTKGKYDAAKPQGLIPTIAGAMLVNKALGPDDFLEGTVYNSKGIELKSGFYAEDLYLVPYPSFEPPVADEVLFKVTTHSWYINNQTLESHTIQEADGSLYMMGKKAWAPVTKVNNDFVYTQLTHASGLFADLEKLGMGTDLKDKIAGRKYFVLTDPDLARFPSFDHTKHEFYDTYGALSPDNAVHDTYFFIVVKTPPPPVPLTTVSKLNDLVHDLQMPNYGSNHLRKARPEDVPDPRHDAVWMLGTTDTISQGRIIREFKDYMKNKYRSITSMLNVSNYLEFVRATSPQKSVVYAAQDMLHFLQVVKDGRDLPRRNMTAEFKLLLATCVQKIPLYNVMRLLTDQSIVDSISTDTSEQKEILGELFYYVAGELDSQLEYVTLDDFEEYHGQIGAPFGEDPDSYNNDLSDYDNDSETGTDSGVSDNDEDREDDVADAA